MGELLKHSLMKSTSHGEGVYEVDPVYQLVMDAVFRVSCRVYETGSTCTATAQQHTQHRCQAALVEQFCKQKDILRSLECSSANAPCTIPSLVQEQEEQTGDAHA